MAEQINLEPDKQYKLEIEVTGKEIAAIMQKLYDMPYNVVSSPILQINSQLIALTKIEDK